MAEDPPATPRRQHGHSRAYILDRLRRENRTDFVDAIERGEVSAFAIAVSLGWTQRPPTLAAITHQARKRRHRFQAIDGSLSGSQAFELWLGPNPTQGSLFSSREELEQAWQQHRAEVMRLWGSHGRRPAGFYEFEWDGPRPPYDRERSFLYDHNVLSQQERTELELEWCKEFEHACSLEDAAARKSHLDWADVPHSLRQRWQAERRRRERRPAAPSEEAAATK